MSTHADADLGHTVAGWTGTTITIVGCATCGFGAMTASAPLILAGAAILAVAALATWMLHLAGWGKPSGPRPSDQWDWRVKDPNAGDGHPNCLGCRIARRRPAQAHQPLTDPLAEETQEPELTEMKLEEEALARTARPEPTRLAYAAADSPSAAALSAADRR